MTKVERLINAIMGMKTGGSKPVEIEAYILSGMRVASAVTRGGWFETGLLSKDLGTDVVFRMRLNQKYAAAWEKFFGAYQGIYRVSNGSQIALTNTSKGSVYFVDEEIDFTLNLAEMYADVNGITTPLTHNDFFLDGDKTIQFGAAMSSGLQSGSCAGIIREFSIVKSGELIRRYFPCEKLDGTICAWDSVNNQYSYNLGTSYYIPEERIGYISGGVAYNMNGEPL